MLTVCYSEGVLLCICWLGQNDAASKRGVSSAHYNVEHRVVMDSGGVRVQITRFVKMGFGDDDKDDNDDGDDDGDDFGNEAAFDFGLEVEKLFQALSDDHPDPESDVDRSPETTDRNPDGLNPNMLPSHDGRPSDIRALEGHPDHHDRVRMRLRDDGMATDPAHVLLHRSGAEDSGWETSTAVVHASHVIRAKDSRRSAFPPQSVFAKLAPSRDRYTILRDEL